MGRRRGVTGKVVGGTMSIIWPTIANTTIAIRVISKMIFTFCRAKLSHPTCTSDISMTGSEPAEDAAAATGAEGAGGAVAATVATVAAVLVAAVLVAAAVVAVAAVVTGAGRLGLLGIDNAPPLLVVEIC